MSEKKSIFDQLRSLLGKSQKDTKSATPRPGSTSSGALPDALAPAQVPEKTAAPGLANTPKLPVTPQAQSNTAPPALSDSQTKPGPEVDLVIGIDFGTSCTKVVVGDHGWLGQSFAVPVGKGPNGLERYLRPTQVESGCRLETNLKMRLMAEPNSTEVRELVALYLAGVIRDSLKWFSTEGSRRYATRTPVWKLNVGFPAKRIEDGPLVWAYREIVELAAQLGPSDLPLEIASVRSLQDMGDFSSPKRLIPATSVELYPEIAAQLAGYVNSPYRAPGNLILIDVGAGTLDVSTAILHGNSEEDIVSFHFCEVGPYGALELLKARVAALDAVSLGSAQLNLGDFQSGTMPTPESAEEILGLRGQVGCKFIDAFEAESERFAADSIRLTLSCATQFRKLQRDMHANPSFDPWPGQVRFFFTGGGSRLAFYRQHFTDGPFEQELSRYTRWKEFERDRRIHQQGLRLEPLPAPEDLQGLSPDLRRDFDRLSVAHGLAYGSENLMKITASVNS